MPSQMIRVLEPETIEVDFSRNFRMASSYDDLVYRDEPGDPPSLLDDILHQGLKVKPEVSEREGRFVLLRGYRRMTCVLSIRRHRPDLFEKIPVVAYRGLTPAEETRLLLDHGHVKSLNDGESLLAIKELRRLGMSQSAMASMLGKSRAFVQDRTYILDMPECVEQSYLGKFEPGAVPYDTYVPLTHRDIDALHVSHLRGPAEFAKAWQQLQKPPVKGPSRADLESQIETLQSRVKTLEECLRVRNLPVPPAKYGRQECTDAKGRHTRTAV